MKTEVRSAEREAAHAARDAALLGGLAAAGLAIVILASAIGATPLPVSKALAAIFGGGDPVDRAIILEIRLPRAVAAYLAGAALGAGGAVLQGLLRNPLAEPGVLGVSASATFCATLVVYTGAAAGSGLVLPAAATAGACLATLAIASAGAAIHRADTLILVGVGVSSIMGALIALLMNVAPHPFTLSDMVSWTQGSVANRSARDIAFATPFLCAGAVMSAFCARDLRTLALGEEAASSLGVQLARLRATSILAAGLMTGGSIALAGAIGFVGIVAPHFVRPWVRHDPARTLAPAGLLGGIMVVAADMIVRLVQSPMELRLGVVAALLGGPVFVLIVARRGRYGA